MRLWAKEEARLVRSRCLNQGYDPFVDPALTLLEARQAQAAWNTLPLKQRLRVIRRFRHLLARDAEEIAQSASDPGARSISEILTAEILPLADACRFLERKGGEILRPRRLGVRGRPCWLWGATSEIRREPFGVVLIIAPSNYPIFLPGVQIVQALAAGNAVVLKPGVGGTAAALSLAHRLHQAGLLPGTLRVLPESTDAAQSAVRMGIDKLVFTGSAETGVQILADIAPGVVPAAMELSGCDAMVVRADADLDMVVRALVFGLRLNSGRTCIATRRVIVARSIATELEGRLSQALATVPRIKLADARNNRLLPLVSQAISSGAHLLAGELHVDRSITAPLVLAGVPLASRLLKEDLFAPVISVITASDDSEAVCLVNQCPYGLGASIFSRDVEAAKIIASRIAVGNVAINDLIVPTADPRLPFGGRGLSGFGTTRGSEGLLEMTTLKVISLREGTMRPHYDPTNPGDDKLFLNFLTLLHSERWRPKLSALVSVCRELLRRTKTQTQKLNA